MTDRQPLKIGEIKAFARGQLIGRYGTAIAAGFLVTAIQLIVSLVTGSSSYNSITTYLIGVVITIIVDLLMGILIFGQAYFFLKIARGDSTAKASDVFYGFTHNMDKAIMVEVPFTVFKMAAIIPAILANMGFIQLTDNIYPFFICALYLIETIMLVVSELLLGLAFYILADNPDLTVTEIFNLALSKISGKRVKLFLIYISSIPLAILSFLACCVGIFWFAAYFQTVLANFYLDCIGEKPWSIEDELTLRRNSDDGSYPPGSFDIRV